MASGISRYCDDQSSEIAVTPVIEQSTSRLRKAIKHSNSKGSVDVLMLGDSLAEKWRPLLKSDFARFSIYNMGISGERTQELVWRIRNLKPSIEPRNIILIIGTNNFSDKLMKSCGIYSGILLSIEEVKKAWPAASLYVLQMLPRGEEFKYRNQERKEINKAIGMEMNERRLGVFISIKEEELTCGGQRHSCENYSEDGLHLTEKGYRILEKSVLELGLN